eukprot:4631880-Amphidinium_carterae.1
MGNLGLRSKSLRCYDKTQNEQINSEVDKENDKTVSENKLTKTSKNEQFDNKNKSRDLCSTPVVGTCRTLLAGDGQQDDTLADGVPDLSCVVCSLRISSKMTMFESRHLVQLSLARYEGTGCT